MNQTDQENRNQKSEIGNPQSAVRNLVTFRLDRQTYALPIEPIAQIVEMVTITPIPQVNHSVEGVINVRGAAVPVVNLRRHLGLPEARLQLHTPLILVQVGERLVGLIVDQVLDVLALGDEQLARPSDILPGELGEAPILQGLAHTPKGMVMLLDLERLLATGRVRALAQTLADGELVPCPLTLPVSPASQAQLPLELSLVPQAVELAGEERSA